MHTKSDESGVILPRYNHIADFGETLDFSFLVEEEGFCYPNVSLSGAEGTSATLHGQHMEPEEIERLGLALIQFANKLRHKIN